MRQRLFQTMFAFLQDLDNDIREALLIQLRNLWSHTSTAIEGKGGIREIPDKRIGRAPDERIWEGFDPFFKKLT